MTVNADFFTGPHFGGFRDEMDHVLLLDMAIHSFDQGRMLMQADPLSVYCHEWNPENSWYKHGASAQCIFEMSDGIVFNYRGSWCAEGLNTSWHCDWRIVCEKGTVTWDGDSEIKAEIISKPEGWIYEHEELEVPVDDIPYKKHKGVIMEFVDAIQNGKEPQTICTDNIKSLAMVISAIESAEKESKVTIAI